jgi:hypothetical protein
LKLRQLGAVRSRLESGSLNHLDAAI